MCLPDGTWLTGRQRSTVGKYRQEHMMKATFLKSFLAAIAIAIAVASCTSPNARSDSDYDSFEYQH
jgi:hypothetical protein